MYQPEALPDCSDLKIIDVYGDHRGCYEMFSTPENAIGFRVWYYNFALHPTAFHGQNIDEKQSTGAILSLERLRDATPLKPLSTPWGKKALASRSIVGIYKAFTFESEREVAFGVAKRGLNDRHASLVMRTHVFIATPRGELFSIPTYRLKMSQREDSLSCIVTRSSRFAFENVQGNGNCFKLYLDEVPVSRTIVLSGFMNGDVLSHLLANLNELAKRAATGAVNT